MPTPSLTTTPPPPTENQFCPAAESKCLQHKHLHFRKTRIPSQVLDWFEDTERVCVNTLEFDKVRVDANGLGPSHSTSRRGGGAGRGVATGGYDIEFSTGVNGVEYGQHITRTWVTERELKRKFLKHRNFECQKFVWNEIVVDRTCTLSL